MEKVKISTLPKDTIVYVDGNSNIVTVAEILEDIKYYKEKELYTTTVRHASFDAEDIIENAIEIEYCDGMYEDWDDSIRADITKEDIEEMQAIFNRILARNPEQNIAYESDKPIEIDV